MRNLSLRLSASLIIDSENLIDMDSVPVNLSVAAAEKKWMMSRLKILYGKNHNPNPNKYSIQIFGTAKYCKIKVRDYSIIYKRKHL